MAKPAKAKVKSENQPISSGDCRQAIHWYTNLLAEEMRSGFGCSRGLFATNFEADDQLLLDTALTNLESKGVKPFIVSGEDLYKQADHVWNLALHQAKYGQPVVTTLEVEMRNSEFLVLTNLDTPLSAHQLWYLYHYVLYPAALAEKPMLISTPLGFEEFVMYGAGCDDFEYAGRPITWEKLISLLNATVMNLYHSKQLQQENLPAMLLPEYRFYRALQERHLNATPHYVANDYLLDFAVIDETAKVKLNIECDFIHRFGLIGKETKTLLSKQIKRDKDLMSGGWQILRFCAKELSGSLDSCVDAIEEIQRNNNKKSSVGRFINLPMLTGSLNLPAQDRDELAAITHSAGPAAIAGGAGTGKSMCIAQRVAFLLGQGVSPERILVISYSTEAIRPLKQAAEKIMPGRLLDKVNFYSWHDLGLRILKENVLTIKRKLPLKIESSPQKILQKLIAKYTKESDSTALELLGYPDEVTVSSAIANFKANLISAQVARENAKNERDLLIAKVYAAHEDQLQKANKIDKDDMVSLAAQILGQEPELRARYENLFEHVIVDEHQDATVACDFLARILACPNDNIIFVGNPDESIYESQGAVPRLLAETSLRVPNASCYLLVHNWRAHPQITKHLEQFISHNDIVGDAKARIEKNTITAWGEVPTQAILGPFEFRDEGVQIDWLMEKVEELLSQGRKPEEIAIVCRSKEQSGELEALLVPQGLVVSTNESDTNVLPDEESDVLTFLKLVADPDGPKAREYFERVCQLRFKGISPKLSVTISDVAESFNVSYLKAVEFYSEAAADPLSNQLEQLVKRIRSMHRDKLSPYEIINLLKRPQWLGDYYKSVKVPPRAVYEPLKVMTHIQEEARTYKTVVEFLKNYSPAKAIQNQTEVGHASLNLLTVAEAKGREFQVVFVPDLVEGRYPGENQTNQGEEARMFYVALTRAREFLYLSCPKTIKNQLYLPSPYLALSGLELIASGLDEEDLRTKRAAIVKEKAIAKEETIAKEKQLIAKKEIVAKEEELMAKDEIIAKKEELMAKEEIIAKEELIAKEEIVAKEEELMAKEEIIAKEEELMAKEEIIAKEELIAKEETIVKEEPLRKVTEVKGLPRKSIEKKQTKEVPAAKSTNIFGLIKEQSVGEIIEEFAVPVVKKGKIDFSDVVRKARQAQIEEQITPEEDANIELPTKKPKSKTTDRSKESKCSNCLATIEPNARFCGECGALQNAATKSVCKSCNQTIDASEKFCGECGAPQ